MEELEKHIYKRAIYFKAVNKDVLLYRVTDEQIKLMEESYNVEANNQELKDEFTFGEIFEQLTIEEIEKIVDSLAENNTKEVTMKTKVKRLSNKINN